MRPHRLVMRVRACTSAIAIKNPKDTQSALVQLGILLQLRAVRRASMAVACALAAERGSKYSHQLYLTVSTGGGKASSMSFTSATGKPGGGVAMSVIQNADLIDARLAMLAEGSLDGDDALNEQAFIEECQLIIAKGAFPASAGSQVQA